MQPLLTRAIQATNFPFPFPIRLSEAFDFIGMLKEKLNHKRTSLKLKVIVLLKDSASEKLSLKFSNAFKPKLPFKSFKFLNSFFFNFLLKTSFVLKVFGVCLSGFLIYYKYIIQLYKKMLQR